MKLKIYLLAGILLSWFSQLYAQSLSGQFGDHVYWSLEDSVLTVSGQGYMSDNVSSYLREIELLGDGHWYDCRYGIKSVIIEEGVTSIGNAAFYDCTSLTSVVIPSTCNYIGTLSFMGCNSLVEVINRRQTPVNIDHEKAFLILWSGDFEVDFDSFYGLDLSKITLYVPKGSIDSYRSDAEWAKFVNMREPKSSDAALQSITVSAGTLSPAFNPDTLSYIVTVPESVTGVTVTATARHSGATVEGGGYRQLHDEWAPFYIYVTAEDSITVKTYAMQVYRSTANGGDNPVDLQLYSGESAVSAVSADRVPLQNIIITAGVLVPAFHPDTLDYAILVPYHTTEITATGVRADGRTASRTHSLIEGTTHFPISALLSVSYNLAVTRPSSRTDLQSLRLSAGDPIKYHPDTLEYKVSVPYSIDTVTIFAKEGVFADNTFSGAGFKQLNVGDNPFEIEVTAESGIHTKTYTITVRRFSNDATLKYLVINGNSLVPPFNPDSLYAIVRNSVNSIAASVIPNHSSATATGNGNHQLSVGLNEISIRVSAEDTRFTSEHAVKVYRKSNDASLSNLRVTGNDEPYEITPPFSPNIFDYSFSVPYLNETVTVTGEPNYNGRFTEFNQKTFSLAVGNNSLAFVNKSEDGNSVTYRLNVRRKKDNAFLKSLSVSPGELAPAFSRDIINYTVRLPYTVTEITVNPETDDEDAITSMGNSGTFSLPNLRDTVEIRVQAEDGTLKVYSIAVRRENPSTDTNLKSLQADAGTLSPAFSPDVFEYSLTVGDCRDSITITAEPNNELVSVSGTDKQPLTVGNSVFHVIVTAEDGEENDYAVSVEKLSCDVSLKFLTVNGDTILPSGDTYNVTVNDMVESATIEAFPSFSGAIVRGEDEKPLNAGNNRFEITVTAENGDEHVYTVNIYRQSGDAALTSITVSPGLLVPEFSPDIFAYTLQISDKEKEFTVETELDSPGAEVSGARTYKTDVQSTVVIKVTAEGGNENIYTLTVDRFSSDATLKSLTLNNGAIPLRFSSDIFEYRVEVEDEVTDITIGGEANHPEATVSGRGPHSLNYGENTFQVTVRAEDTEIGIETSETYTVTVHRISNDPALKSLTIAPAELVPPFDPDITQYTAGVSHQVSSIAIDIETNYPLATCLVSNGDDFGEPGIKPLNVGQNVFGISVFAENKKYYRAYWVRITRGATPTGFHEAGTPAALHVYTANGRLHVDTPAAERVNIYSVTGTLLYSFDKPAGAFRLSAFSFHPASILIVKGSSGWVRKVMM